jgi:histone-lysine N-methyltransferase SETMAR
VSQTSKEDSAHIRRLRGQCSAKLSLEMEEETDWKIETLRGKNPTEIHDAIHEVCGDSVLDRSTMSRWASRFREGRVSIQEDPRSGRPVTATDDTPVVIVSTLLEEDRRKSCEETAHETNMSTASVFRIVTETLQKTKVAAKWVPHQMSEEQKATRKSRRTAAVLRGRK